VWHCSLSLAPDEGPLSDAQWAQAARALVDALGFSEADGKAPCRWVAVRHGPSAGGCDHVHVAVSLVREDGTQASTWHDYRKAGTACAALESRFGLRHLDGRADGRTVPGPSRADAEASARHGDPEPLRTRLERAVRACATAARDEAEFVMLARSRGLLLRPRHAGGTVTGYAVADPGGRIARGEHTGTGGPVWFGGRSLASDLTLPALRRRWQPASPAGTLAAWAAGHAVPLPRSAPAAPRRAGGPARVTAGAGGQATAADAAGVLAAAAAVIEGARPGPLARAARQMARAAQHEPPARTGAVIAGMAGTFLAVTAAGADDGTLALAREAILLAGAVAGRVTATAAAARQARQAAALAATAIPAIERGAASRAVTTARARRAPGPRLPGTVPADTALRDLPGLARWRQHAAGPGRAQVAALLARAAAEGRDVPAILQRAVTAGPQPAGPARGIAPVLRDRISQAMASAPPPAASQPAGLPEQVAAVLSRAAAPPGTAPASPGATRRDPARQPPPPSGRPRGERDSR